MKSAVGNEKATSIFTPVERPPMSEGQRTFQPRSAQAAFTLVELLVVITIIIILLALLIPAMDKAIREAEYAVDGSQVKTIAHGATVYATSNQRSYPHRGANVYNVETKRITHETLWDDRVRFEPYFSLDVFQDPMLPVKVDWSIYYNGREPPTSAGSPQPPPAAKQYIIWSSYTLLFGMTYKDPKAGQGMMKIGQSFEWGGERTHVMVADKDDLWNGTFGWGSHEPASGPLGTETGNSYNHPEGWTIDRWNYLDMSKRGTLDNQFALTDGSVGRIRDLEASNGADNHDERLMAINFYPVENNTYPGYDTRIPRQ